MSNEHTYMIVVGVDGSPASKAALRWAVWHAGLAHGAITALTAWHAPHVYDWDVPGLQGVVDTAAKKLSEVVEEVVGDTEVAVRKEVAQGHPARALLDIAEQSNADLLVLGNRGHGGFTEALLGSVSQYCVHHARCPVVIVRGHSAQ
ncbi:nucleotide-binding universal stress UspA family protein [Saccharopolyspora erythraea NRRL 2338]|uniref:Stress-inducible protein n=2 Tax=Saccharopolyspora erythraea TaxID=1836 RepID=A4FCE4_SACEN|nr:universal stress protein [Saccharopolyspora erythraea]EQD83902.1 stress-inducible protein [Saccharopolyspora erythraea D]PFG95482.1 nucleotide-binding universal stress UspA family protein [Saccharopolyspora erythraea NRRL 2338]QRK92112.1 universal stress protein [Saccharopolyspora erythraea]CAM01719.1 stress-inducible protein [Saccharopolyspora erythraea NRRL 2338]